MSDSLPFAEDPVLGFPLPRDEELAAGYAEYLALYEKETCPKLQRRWKKLLELLPSSENNAPGTASCSVCSAHQSKGPRSSQEDSPAADDRTLADLPRALVASETSSDTLPQCAKGAQQQDDLEPPASPIAADPAPSAPSPAVSSSSSASAAGQLSSELEHVSPSQSGADSEDCSKPVRNDLSVHIERRPRTGDDSSISPGMSSAPAFSESSTAVPVSSATGSISAADAFLLASTTKFASPTSYLTPDDPLFVNGIAETTIEDIDAADHTLYAHLESMNRHKLKRMIRKGIPSELRWRIWYFTSGAYKRRNENPQYYKFCLRLARRHSKESGSIGRDVDRTFPEHPFFRSADGFQHVGRGSVTVDENGLLSGSVGQTRLSRLLNAFSVHCSSVGYCQSLNFLAGALLLIMSEERAFWVLICLLEQLLPKDMHGLNLFGFRVEQVVLGELVARYAPALSKHMRAHELSTEVFTSSWFLCCFLNVMPVPSVLRVWDVLMNEGSKILFRVSLSIILENEQALLEATSPGDVVILMKQHCQAAFHADRILRSGFSLRNLSMQNIVRRREKATIVVEKEDERRDRARKEAEERLARRQSNIFDMSKLSAASESGDGEDDVRDAASPCRRKGTETEQRGVHFEETDTPAAGAAVVYDAVPGPGQDDDAESVDDTGEVQVIAVHD